MYCVYVIKSRKNHSLYIRSTNNLDRRMQEHNTGKSGHTEKYRPYDLMYFEAYRAETDVRKREHNLKLRGNAYNQLKKRMVESLKTN
jgi:putative endonuclease